MTGGRWRPALGATLALAATAGLALLSGVRAGSGPAAGALLRLSWRALGEQVRTCRRLTPQELAEVPAHMRQEEVCERHIVPYRLRVMLDSAVVLDELVRAGGAHEDRPLYVYFELPVKTGAHRLGVTFEHVLGPGPFREAEEHPAHEVRETPPLLTLERHIVMSPGAIVLVTYDDEAKELRLVNGER